MRLAAVLPFVVAGFVLPSAQSPQVAPPPSAPQSQRALPLLWVPQSTELLRVTPTVPGNLELRLQPEAIYDGVPGAFTFWLINRSDHDVRVPMPSVECGNGYNGAVWLRVRFKPMVPGPAAVMHGCILDSFRQDVLDRASKWKVLHSQGAMQLHAKTGELYLNEEAAGTYELWADYQAPAVSEQEAQTLRRAGIDFPHGDLSSPHFIFKKR